MMLCCAFAAANSCRVHIIASAALARTLDVPRIFENMKNTTKLIRVDVAFLFQLADMTVGGETPAELQAKAFSAYQMAHKAVAADYEKLASARKEMALARIALRPLLVSQNRETEQRSSLYGSRARTTFLVRRGSS